MNERVSRAVADQRCVRRFTRPRRKSREVAHAARLRARAARQDGWHHLACKPAAIRIGQLICQTEPHMNLLECFDRETNRCPITPACTLKRALAEARKAFVDALDACTLEDLLTHRPQLVQFLAGNLRSARG
jgi:DNA-binding IscR family transcriptional regulator